jgi:hypothetical protein
MKRFYAVLPTFFACFLFCIASAQDLPDFGKIDMADMQLKECPFDKSANAMNLIKTEKVTFSVDAYTGDPKTVTEYRVRIKIFDESGFSNASISIPYIGNSRVTKINDIEGVIFNVDESGNIITQKLEKDQVFREKAKGKTSHNIVRFTFPGLKKGSVIEYRYSKTTKNGFGIAPWFFQEELPSRFTKCSINFPSSIYEMKLHFVASRPIEKDSAENIFSNRFYNESIRGFAMRDVPAFKPEPLMTAFADNLQRVQFSLMDKNTFLFNDNVRWNWYNVRLLKSPYFGLQFTQPVAGSNAFIDSVKALKNASDKISMVYQYVKRIISWNGEQTFYSGGIDECIKDRSGSSAEMNILLLNLLRKVDVKCFPALISTRENGKVDKTFPTLSQFNGVDILTISDDTVFVLDCTQKSLSYRTTPFNVLNCEAFIIDKDVNKWVLISDKRSLMNTELYVNALMDSTGIMTGLGRIIYTGIAKAEKIKDEEKEKKQQSKELLDDDAPVDLKIDSSTEEHGDDDLDTLLHTITFHASLSNTENLYFLNPFMFSFFRKNPFKDSIRYSDVDFGCNQSYVTRILVAVPQNFDIEDVPKSITIRTEDSSIIFKREFLTANNQVLIRHSFSFNRALFSSDEYTGLKTFFDKVYALINEQIVLKRKE